LGGMAQAITIAGNTNNSSPADILSLHYDPASFTFMCRWVQVRRI
jgi:hypothetical protein